jgi:AcrR family transcriptional regulator
MPKTENRSSNERAGTKELRKFLLGVVYELVSENGIEGTGMRAVAERAELSTGTINYHFGNKQTLLLKAYDAAFELPEDWEDYSGSAFRNLKRLIRGYAFRSRNDRFWCFWANFTARSTRDEEMRERQGKRYARQQEFWERLLRDGIEEGTVAPNTDCAVEAERLMVFAYGLVVRQIMDPSVATRERCKELIEMELDRLST